MSVWVRTQLLAIKHLFWTILHSNAFVQLTQDYVMACLSSWSPLLNWCAIWQQNLAYFTIARMAEGLRCWTLIPMDECLRGLEPHSRQSSIFSNQRFAHMHLSSWPNTVCSSLFIWCAKRQQNLASFSIARMAEWIRRWTWVPMDICPCGFKPHLFWPLHLSNAFDPRLCYCFIVWL